MSNAHGRTALSAEQYASALATVRKFLKRAGHINNRTLREITGLNYDQAIKFFNSAIADGILVRRGRASGIHYVIPPEHPS